MIEMRALKGSTNSVSQDLFGKSGIRLDNPAFAMRPLWLNRVEPRAFDWQETNQDTNSFACLFVNAIMFTDPSTHSLAGMPTGFVPNHCQNRLVQLFNFLATPLQKLNSEATHWSSIDETQQHSKGCPSQPGLWGQGHLSAWFVRPTPTVAHLYTNLTDWAEKSGSTKSRLESPKPIHAPVPTPLFGRKTFFTLICWIGTCDPVLEALQSLSVTIVTDLA